MNKVVNNTMLEARIRLTLNDQWQVLSVSDGMDALLGFRPQDFLAARVTLQDLIHAHDLDIADVLFSAEVRSEAGTVNIRLRHANGRIRCVKAHYKKETCRDGHSLILEMLLQDAKSLGQDPGEQLMMANTRAMMENSDDYIYFKDRNHVFTGASQTLVSLTDPTESWTDLIGQTDYDVFPEEYADIYYRLEKQVFAGIAVAHEIQEILSNDGKKGWVDNRKYPIRDGDGEIIGLFGIARDITERKRTEEALRESEERLRLALDASNQGWFDADLVSGKVIVSPEYVHILGYTPDDFQADLASWLRHVHPEDQDVLASALQSCIKDGGPNTMEYRRETKSGEWRWIRSVGKIVQWDAGQRATRMIGIHTDITERKQMEEQIRQLAFFDPLTKLPNRRLLNDRLSQAMAAGKRSGCFGAVMFLDLDNFKPLNDTHGHEVGDLLLIEVADRLKNCVRGMDTVARFGGDEFVVMISELVADKTGSTAQAVLIAEKIRIALAQVYWLIVKHEDGAKTLVEHQCTASIGISLFNNHEASQNDILKWADLAMYQAKEAGRNAVRIAQEVPQPSVTGETLG